MLKIIVPISLLVVLIAAGLYKWNQYLQANEKESDLSELILKAEPSVQQKDIYQQIPTPPIEWPEEQRDDVDDLSFDPDEEVDWGTETILAEWNYLPEIHPFSFEFLWDEPADDRDSIEAALTFAPEMDLEMVFSPLLFVIEPSSYIDIGHIKVKKGTNAYLSIMQYLHQYRNKADLPSIAEAYIDLLPLFISHETYEEMWLGQTIRQLLFTYNDLLDGTNDFSRFEIIYELMIENEHIEMFGEDYHQERKRQYRAIAQVTNVTEHLNKFVDIYENVSHIRIVWAYSFWARRYAEGNHQDVYYILKRIQQVYHNGEEEENEDLTD